MARFERFLSVIVVGACAPVVGFLAGWWTSFLLLGDSPAIPWAALGGLLGGIALDAALVRPRLRSLARMSMPALAAFAVFYSVLIYGFFMGFPAVNLIVGAAWGFVMGRRHVADRLRTESARRDVRTASLASAGIMFALCCATAWLAFNEPTIASQVRGMLGLWFTPSLAQLWVLAVLGGAALVGGEYLVATGAARWAARGAA